MGGPTRWSPLPDGLLLNRIGGLAAFAASAFVAISIRRRGQRCLLHSQRRPSRLGGPPFFVHIGQEII